MGNEINETLATIIAKYLAECANEQEKSFLEDWINESGENTMYFNQIKQVWESAEKSRLQSAINSDKALNTVLSRIAERSVLNILWDFWTKAAAILLIPVIVFNILWLLQKPFKAQSASSPVYCEAYAMFGTRSALKLVDGTQVWLNSGSSLKYPDKFTGGRREVFLNGEAYFEVTSNEKMPFIVKTADLEVKATGTKFNIQGYKSDIKSEVTLIDGKVFVCKTDSSGNTLVLSELFPNQHFVFDKNTKQVTVRNEETYKFYSWKDGKLIFRNEPMSNVVKKLSQVFNVDIELQGTALQNYRYRATFEDESLSEILKLLEISSPIRYTEVKRYPLPDGTFPKKKVIIYPAKN